MLEIKIYYSLEDNMGTRYVQIIKNIVAEQNIYCTIKQITDKYALRKMGIFNKPQIVVSNRIVFCGKGLTKDIFRDILYQINIKN